MAFGSNRGVNFSITASDKTRAAFSSVQNSMRSTQRVQKSWNKGLNQNRRAVQQFGFQMTDFSIQIAGGQDAMLAFTQQGGQMLQVFGPAGAIMAALLAVFGSLFIAINKSGTAMNELVPIAGVMADDFRLIGTVLKSTLGHLIDFTNAFLNNFDKILITLGVILGFFLTKWVVGFVAGFATTRIGIRLLSISWGGLSAAMVFNNAVAVASGRIVAANTVGQWLHAQALGAVTVALGVMNAGLIIFRGILISLGIPALVIALFFLVSKFVDLVKATGSTGAALSLLKDVFVEAFDKMIAKGKLWVIEFFIWLNEISAKFFVWVGDLKLSFAGMIDSFNAALNDTFGFELSTDNADASMEKTTDLLAALTDELLLLKNAGFELEDFLKKPNESLAKLVALLKSAKDGDFDIRDLFGGSKDGKDGKLSDEAKRIEKLFEDTSKSISNTIRSNFEALRKGTKSAGDFIQDILIGILDKMIQIATQPVFDNIANGIAGLIVNKPAGGTGGSATGGLGGIVGSFITSVFGGFKAKGGPVSAGKSYVVGEEGPELLTLGSSGHVTPNSALGGGGGGQSIEVHIHENASDGKTRTEQSPGRIDVFLRKAVSDTISSGGADKALSNRYGLRQKPMGA